MAAKDAFAALGHCTQQITTSVCPMLQVAKKTSKYMPVYADLNADADNPAGEDVTHVLGAQHSGSNTLEHFATSKLDANQAALQNEILLSWTHLAHTGNSVARTLRRGSATAPASTR